MNKRFTFLLASLLTLSMFASKAQITITQNNFTGVIVPQYGTARYTGVNPGKLPIIFRATISNLLPNSTYDYVVKAVASSATGVQWGAGDMLHITSAGTVNFYSGIGQMNQAVATLTTDATGSYTGWFGIVQTNDATFDPANTILPLIHVGDGSTGNNPIYSFKMNGGNDITMKSYGTGTASPVPVSSIYGESQAASKNVIVLYNNTTASGRPISTAMVESENIPSGTLGQNPTWYQTNVDGYVGTYTRWGAIFLNDGLGVKRLEQLSVADGTLIGCATDPDGVWPSGVSTVAAYGAQTTPKFVANTDAPLNACGNPQDITGVSVSNTCFTEATFSWTKPTGYNNATSNIVVFAKAGSAITPGIPSNNVSTVTASTIFGSGTAYQNDPAAFAVYKGDGNTVDISGLSNNTAYHFLVYNIIGTNNYSGGVTASFTTLNTQPLNVGGLTASVGNGLLTIDWSAPPSCYDEILVIARQGTAVTSTPTGDGTLYTASSVFADLNINSNANLNAGDYAVYKGIDTAVVVSELVNNTAYYFTIFTRKGTAWSAGISVNAIPTAVSGDYRSRQNGNWSNFTTWERYNGTTWVNATTGQTPNSSTTNVIIQTGHTVDLDASARQVNTLTVEAGAKLWCNSNAIATTTYLYIYGASIVINGQLGNYPTSSDDISFAIENSNCFLSGSGLATNCALSRLIKRGAAQLVPANTTISKLTITRSMYITYPGTGLTNLDSDGDVFDIVISPTYTVTCLSDVSIDGPDGSNGNNGSRFHGYFLVNGTLNINGKLYTTTDNNLGRPAAAGGGVSCKLTIGNGGVVNTNSIDATASAMGGFLVTVNNNGLLNISGTPTFTVFDLTNNGYTLNTGSEVEYSAAGAQTVQSALNYRHLTLSGSGNKTPSATTLTVLDIDENLTINGTAVLVPAAGTQINLTGNWTSYGQAGFTEGTSTVYFNSTGTQVLNTTGGEVFNNVTKNGSTDVFSPAKILLNSDMTVSGVLDLGSGALYSQVDFSTSPHTVTLSNMSTADCFKGSATTSVSMSQNVAHHFYIGCQSPSFTGTLSCSMLSTVHYNRSTGTQTVLGGNNIVYGKLEINNATGVTLGASAQLINQLILTAGKVTTNAFELYVNNPSTNSITGHGATKYVIGNLRRAVASTDTFDFPLGTATSYNLIQLIPDNLVGVSNVLGSFSSAFTSTLPYPTVSGVLINTLLNGGIWTLTPNVQPSGGNYDLVLHQRGYGNPAAGAMYYTAVNRPAPGSPWVHNGLSNATFNSVASGTVTVPYNNLTSFSDFGIGYGNAVLPVTLTAFDATVFGDDVMLSWHTASELNNAYFDVETSVDGKTFTKIGSVNGHGTTVEAHSYNLVHTNPATGVNYYRLKQVDTDNTPTYSHIRAVEFLGAGSDVVIGVYPVPASSELNVIGVEENALVGVYDLSGKLLVSTVGNGGATLVKLDALSSGLYLLKVENANSSYTRLFTKQ